MHGDLAPAKPVLLILEVVHQGLLVSGPDSSCKAACHLRSSCCSRAVVEGKPPAHELLLSGSHGSCFHGTIKEPVGISLDGSLGEEPSVGRAPHEGHGLSCLASLDSKSPAGLPGILEKGTSPPRLLHHRLLPAILPLVDIGGLSGAPGASGVPPARRHGC